MNALNGQDDEKKANDEDKMIPLYVPESIYQEMVEELGERMKRRRQPEEKRFKGWTAAEIARLKHGVTNKTVHTLFDMTQRGRRVTFDELCQATGRTRREVMGDLAGLTQWIKRHLGKDGRIMASWPLNVTYDGHGSPSYHMPVEIVQWWKEA